MSKEQMASNFIRLEVMLVRDRSLMTADKYLAQNDPPPSLSSSVIFPMPPNFQVDVNQNVHLARYRTPYRMQ